MDYMDFLQSYIKNRGNPVKFAQDFYNDLYDNSHGADRYYLSKLPWFSWWRKLQDSAKQAQDQWDNTQTDPAYITRVNDGTDNSLSNAVGRAIRMSNSLSEMYRPEIIEDVQKQSNNSYW